MTPSLAGHLLLFSAVAAGMPMPVRGAVAQTAPRAQRTCTPAPDMPADTVTLILSLEPPATVSDSAELDRGRQDAQAIAGQFVPPVKLSLREWPLATPAMIQYWSQGLAGTWGLAATLALHTDSAGHLIDATLTDSAGAPELNDALLRAAHRADSLGALAAPLEKAGDAVRLTLFTATEPVSVDAPLMRVRVPYVEPNIPVTIKHQPYPHYPDVAARVHLESSVDLNFIVDEQGRAIPSSITLVHADFKEFLASAVHVVLHSQFNPARWGTCPIKQLVHQRINFKIGR